jgi:hypothetical protein
MVHLVDAAQNDKIITQGDSANPVYGFYPTSRWHKGEIVRDDYALTVPRNLMVEKLNLVVDWYPSDPSGTAFPTWVRFGLMRQLRIDRCNSNKWGLRALNTNLALVNVVLIGESKYDRLGSCHELAEVKKGRTLRRTSP